MTAQGPCSRNYVDSVARLRIALVSRSSPSALPAPKDRYTESLAAGPIDTAHSELTKSPLSSSISSSRCHTSVRLTLIARA